MGDGEAVENHAKEIGGGLIDAGAHLVTAAPTLAALHHVVNGREGNVGGRLEPHGAGATECGPFLDESYGSLGLLGSEEVEGTELVFLSPASPVAKRAEVLQHLFLGRYSLLRHRPSGKLRMLRVLG